MNVLDLIGNTTMVELNTMSPKKNVKILCKCEARNPGGSIKDRIALSMIEAGEKSGKLNKDKIVLEATSGNTGIGLAMVCAVKGYKCLLIMPESASIERRKIMRAYGAEIMLTPARKATDGAIEESYRLLRENPDLYYLTDQYNCEANWQAHYRTTAPEIMAQTDGKVTHVVTTLGTSGTAMGLSRWFRDNNPATRIIAMEPFLGHAIQGLKNMKESYRPTIFDRKLPHKIVNVKDEDAFRTTRELARKEGIFAGMSSGAALFAALEIAQELEEGVIVVILPDGGERYLSTSLFALEHNQENQDASLCFHNSMSRKKEVFKPLRNNHVSFYACGPTVYEPANLAHCRRFVVADLMIRYLKVKGYQVDSYMNFTDIDDNTLKGAEEAGLSLVEFTEKYIKEHKKVLKMLGCEKATGYPKASDHVQDMIDISHELIHKGYAYEKHGSVYFDISKFPAYGRLSGVDLSKIQIGHTVDLDDYEKDNPRDFTLLKRASLNDLKTGAFYPTDWGNVRPGWHIECSAMSTRYLGETLDIHTASQDLIFPHHENEIAIAEALTGKPLANFWLHSGLLLKDGKKMSAANKNILTFQELIDKGYSGREIRFFLIGSHYRKPLNFTWKKMESVRMGLKRLDTFTRKLICLKPLKKHPQIENMTGVLEENFFQALDDDLNISKAMASLFDFIKETNPILDLANIDEKQHDLIFNVLEKINSVLGILQLKQCILAPEIEELIKVREQARKQENWQAADQARARLLELGVIIHDTAIGSVWELSDEACEKCQQPKKKSC